MKNRLQRFLVVSTLLLMIIPLSLLVIRTTKASGDWQQPVSYFSSVLLNNNNSAYVGNCVADRSEFVGSNYNSSGALNWHIPKASAALPCPLAIDATGAIYATTTTKHGNAWIQHITKYANGQVVWDIVPPNVGLILVLSLGTDGNIYAVTDTTENTGGSIGLLGINPVLTAGETSPQIILDEPLNIQAGNFSGFSVYNNGLVVSSRSNGVSGELLQYLGYDGSIQSSVNISNPGAVDVFAATLDGRVFVPQVDISTSHCTPDPTGYADESSVVAYGPAGQQWSYTLPACSVVYAVRPTPDGGIVLWINNNGSTQYLLSVNNGGTDRWPNPLSIGGVLGDTTYALNALYVTTAGDIATVEDYTQSDNNEGVIISLNSGSDGSQLWTHEFVPTANQGGYTYSGGGNQGFGIAQGMVYILVTHCMYSTNGGVPGCGGQTLYGLNAPGMELDYPRGTVIGGQPVPCPALQFIGVMGSGEGSTYKKYGYYGQEVSAVKDALLKQFPAMATMAIDYPAVPIDPTTLVLPSDYVASVQAGENNLYSTLSDFNTRCPTPPIVLVGYSQGAEVVGDVVQQLPLAAIAGVLLFGDPLFNPNQTAVDQGTYNKKFEGIVAAVGGFPPRTVYPIMIGRFESYCLKGDLVCNFDLQNAETCPLSNSCPHYHYVSKWTTQGEQWLAGILP